MDEMKPIRFPPPIADDMVRALLADRKTVTRRVVRPRYCDSVFEMVGGELCEASPYKPPIDNGDGTTTRFVRHYVLCKPPYCPGDILYVRETFQIDYLSNIPGTGRIHYKADDTYADFSFPPERYEMMRRAQLKPGWRPNVNMPREAARIFLRVTDVRVERLQDITEEQARAEGVSPVMITTDVEKPDSEKEWHGWGPALPGFIVLWDSTIRNGARTLYGWGADPWVWVIEFERCEKPEERAP